MPESRFGRQQVELLDQQYLTGVLADLLDLVEGSGPMNHAARRLICTECRQVSNRAAVPGYSQRS